MRRTMLIVSVASAIVAALGLGSQAFAQRLPLWPARLRRSANPQG